MCTPSNSASFGQPESTTPNGISIGSAIFTELTIVTDGQTDRPTDHATPSVTVGRIIRTQNWDAT